MRVLTKKAAGGESGGKREDARLGSGFEGVGALPVSGFNGNNGQTHLLAHGTRDESPNRMRLPVGCLHDLLQGGPARPIEQTEDGLSLASLAEALLCGGDGRLFRAGGSGLAFQIRDTAVGRSLNFLTGVAPGRLFQISTSRAGGQ
jgi:hypothetical protein